MHSLKKSGVSFKTRTNAASRTIEGLRKNAEESPDTLQAVRNFFGDDAVDAALKILAKIEEGPSVAARFKVTETMCNS
ncbi:MAG: hypothetical protein WCW36_03800 [Candidatus Paceibacterota bacterium]